MQTNRITMLPFTPSFETQFTAVGIELLTIASKGVKGLLTN